MIVVSRDDGMMVPVRSNLSQGYRCGLVLVVLADEMDGEADRAERCDEPTEDQGESR